MIWRSGGLYDSVVSIWIAVVDGSLRVSVGILLWWYDGTWESATIITAHTTPTWLEREIKNFGATPRVTYGYLLGLVSTIRYYPDGKIRDLMS